MNVTFDTSVLVAGIIARHAHHARARIWLEAVGRGDLDGSMSWHAMAETWSVLTRLPQEPRLSGEQALALVAELRAPFELVEPSQEIYEEALRRCAVKGLSSGAVFDALHLVSAEVIGLAPRQAAESLPRGQSRRLLSALALTKATGNEPETGPPALADPFSICTSPLPPLAAPSTRSSPTLHPSFRQRG